jgi:hypothetical protein
VEKLIQAAIANAPSNPEGGPKPVEVLQTPEIRRFQETITKRL